MEVQLCCSEQIKEKMNRVFTKSGICISADAKIVLVERGFELPSDKLAVVFDPIDYVEAVELLLNKDCESMQVSPDTITGFSDNRYCLIPVEEINHIDANGTEIICHTGQKRYYLKNTLQYYQETLSRHGVIRINKSQLVNIINVKEIIPWFNGRLVLVLKNNRELEVSRFYSKTLRKTLNI